MRSLSEISPFLSRSLLGGVQEYIPVFESTQSGTSTTISISAAGTASSTTAFNATDLGGMTPIPFSSAPPPMQEGTSAAGNPQKFRHMLGNNSNEMSSSNATTTTTSWPSPTTSSNMNGLLYYTVFMAALVMVSFMLLHGIVNLLYRRFLESSYPLPNQLVMPGMESAFLGLLMMAITLNAFLVLPAGPSSAAASSSNSSSYDPGNATADKSHGFGVNQQSTSAVALVLCLLPVPYIIFLWWITLARIMHASSAQTSQEAQELNFHPQAPVVDINTSSLGHDARAEGIKRILPSSSDDMHDIPAMWFTSEGADESRSFNVEADILGMSIEQDRGGSLQRPQFDDSYQPNISEKSEGFCAESNCSQNYSSEADVGCALDYENDDGDDDILMSGPHWIPPLSPLNCLTLASQQEDRTHTAHAHSQIISAGGVKGVQPAPSEDTRLGKGVVGEEQQEDQECLGQPSHAAGISRMLPQHTSSAELPPNLDLAVERQRTSQLVRPTSFLANKKIHSNSSGLRIPTNTIHNSSKRIESDHTYPQGGNRSMCRGLNVGSVGTKVTTITSGPDQRQSDSRTNAVDGSVAQKERAQLLEGTDFGADNLMIVRGRCSIYTLPCSSRSTSSSPERQEGRADSSPGSHPVHSLQGELREDWRGVTVSNRRGGPVAEAVQETSSARSTDHAEEDALQDDMCICTSHALDEALKEEPGMSPQCHQFKATPEAATKTLRAVEVPSAELKTYKSQEVQQSFTLPSQTTSPLGALSATGSATASLKLSLSGPGSTVAPLLMGPLVGSARRSFWDKASSGLTTAATSSMHHLSNLVALKENSAKAGSRGAERCAKGREDIYMLPGPLVSENSCIQRSWAAAAPPHHEGMPSMNFQPRLTDVAGPTLDGDFSTRPGQVTTYSNKKHRLLTIWLFPPQSFLIRFEYLFEEVTGGSEEFNKHREVWYRLIACALNFTHKAFCAALLGGFSGQTLSWTQLSLLLGLHLFMILYILAVRPYAQWQYSVLEVAAHSLHAALTIAAMSLAMTSSESKQQAINWAMVAMLLAIVLLLLLYESWGLIQVLKRLYCWWRSKQGIVMDLEAGQAPVVAEIPQQRQSGIGSGTCQSEVLPAELPEVLSASDQASETHALTSPERAQLHQGCQHDCQPPEYKSPGSEPALMSGVSPNAIVCATNNDNSSTSCVGEEARLALPEHNMSNPGNASSGGGISATITDRQPSLKAAILPSSVSNDVSLGASSAAAAPFFQGALSPAHPDHTIGPNSLTMAALDGDIQLPPQHDLPAVSTSLASSPAVQCLRQASVATPLSSSWLQRSVRKVLSEYRIAKQRAASDPVIGTSPPPDIQFMAAPEGSSSSVATGQVASRPPHAWPRIKRDTWHKAHSTGGQISPTFKQIEEEEKQADNSFGSPPTISAPCISTRKVLSAWAHKQPDEA
ncbi:hypothetical protein CEUSTIGMA_g3637.t1 [Chlamydomonas eustigma]|uniref:TRP C-terminal domain-containing protein n=1 Tax=Chlamydomonas eustigma TaxID=1157962 RepID=A0A250WZC3_9CHLO|nr:hypothetical protein CEUSTIGMA_g3637.t1 [Chlamydomonas eustigma]|eukprot:GAX76193.1 hypothetical protein CEUSTIGMA_g3637.t1 [Chlamydomonas eustigma]